MKMSKTLIALMIALSASGSFAAERVAFPGSSCVGAGSKGSSVTIGNGEITCPITLPYAWGTRKITKVRVDISPGYSTSCAIYSTSTSGASLAFKNVAYNAGDVAVNLVLANNYAHLRCFHSAPGWTGATMKINGYIIESDF